MVEQLAGRLRFIAALSTCAGAALAVEAWRHMKQLGQICGGAPAFHCQACYLAAASFALALAAAAAAEVMDFSQLARVRATNL